ncbi:MAG: DUF2339 domain-containing protein [Candidatus Hydrogenedens sp.]|nr:DUF2339 domain-containing protein [Candidatus Hydrogenedens sp.]
MEHPDEVAKIRAELNALLLQARALSQRLEALETRQEPQVEPEAAPPTPREEAVVIAKTAASVPDRPAPATPPPLPRRAAVAAPAPKAETREAAPAAPAPSKQAAPSPLGNALRAAYRAIGPKESMSWEMALGTFWLPRLAVLLLAVGVVWALTLAVQRWGQEWMPLIRIAAGYAVAAALYFGGRYVERKRTGEAAASYLDFGRVMMAGGTALVYFVTFATHYVPYTRIIPQAWITLVLLSAIMAGWGVMAYWRRSWTLAFAVTVLGHFTAALATLTLAQPPTATIVGLLALNLGAGYFIARFGWRLVGVAGVLGGYFNYLLWLANSDSSDTLTALAGGLGVLIAYWLIFAVAEYIASQRDDMRASYRLRNLYLGLNSGGFVFLGMGLMLGFDFAAPYLYAFYFATAAVFLGFGLLYRRSRPDDVIYGTYLTKASAVAALGLADYFSGAALTFSLGLEAVILLYSARRSGLVAPRALALATLAVALAQGMVFVLLRGVDGIGGAAAIPFATALFTLLAGLYFSVLYEKTRWTCIPAESLAAYPTLRQWLWRWTLADRPDTPQGRATEPFAIGTVAALGANVLAAAQMNLFVPANDWNAAVFATLGLSQLALAIAFHLRGLAVGASIAGMTAFVVWIASMVSTGLESPRALAAMHRGYGFVVALSLALMGEACRLFPMSRRKDGGSKAGTRAAYVWEILATLVAMILLVVTSKPPNQPVLLQLLATGISVYALLSGSAAAGFSAFLAFVPGVLLAWVAYASYHAPAWLPLIVMLAFATAQFSEWKWWGERPGLWYHQQAKAGPHVLYLGVAAIIGGWIIQAAEGLPEITGLVILGTIAAVAAYPLNGYALTAVSTAVLMAAAAYGYATRDMDEMLWNRGVWQVAAGAIVAGRLLTWRAAYAVPLAENLLAALAWLVLAQHYLPGDGFLLREQYLALGFLVLGAITRVRATLALAVLASFLATGVALVSAYDGSLPSEQHALVLALGVLFWFALERLVAFARKYGPLAGRDDLAMVQPILVAIPSVVLVCALEREPVLASYYLTIAWTAAAAGLMGLSLITRERYYRYAGLVLFALALCRVALIDTRELEGLYRVGAVMFLGVVLLGVGYGYIKARERGSK